MTSSPYRDLPDDHLLKPSEVADIFGVATGTVAQWARAGRLLSVQTPGGHRRYRWADVRPLLDVDTPTRERLGEEAARLYQRGWSIREIAEKFGYSYGVTRRMLLRRTSLRPQSASRPGRDGGGAD